MSSPLLYKKHASSAERDLDEIFTDRANVEMVKSLQKRSKNHYKKTLEEGFKCECKYCKDRVLAERQKVEAEDSNMNTQNNPLMKHKDSGGEINLHQQIEKVEGRHRAHSTSHLPNIEHEQDTDENFVFLLKWMYKTKFAVKRDTFILYIPDTLAF